MAFDTIYNPPGAGGINPPMAPMVQDLTQEAKPNPFDFKSLQGKVSRLAAEWKTEKVKTDTRRNLCNVSINLKEEQRAGRLKAHEIYIPVRIIKDNIDKEAPQYIAYLTTSRNAAVFKSKKKTDLPMAVVESAFTQMVRFPGWEIPFFKNLNGTQLHAWAAVETVYDKDKPGRFAVEDIAHENLWFHTDLENLQRGPFIVRNCRVTKDELLSFKDANVEEIEKIFQDDDKEQASQEAMKDVQKVFYKNKEDGNIYVCWLHHEMSTDFIRPPKPLWLGRMLITRDASGNPIGEPMRLFETQYPIDIFQYIISENGKIMETKGRAFLDEYTQEASSSLISSIVNAWYLASQVMGAPTNPTSAGGPEQTDIVIQGGKLYSEPIDFFHMPYPDSSGLQIVQGLITQNKSETAQVNFAVNNRQDSRKTAREISAAQSQASLLSGVQVTLYSIFLRNVLTRCWSIAKSMLEQGLITDVELPVEYIFLDYNLYAAGDSEVITREEQLSKLKEAWAVFQSTPAAPIILRAIVDLAFPMYAEEINAALQAANPANIVMSFMQVIQGFMQEFGSAMSNEDTAKLMGILQQGQQYLQAVNPQPPTTQGQPNGTNNPGLHQPSAASPQPQQLPVGAGQAA